VRSKIIEALSDGQFHPITDLNKIRNVARERIDSVLRHMAEEEEIEMSLSKIRLTPGQE
jgi:hypothetical protein